MFFRSDDPIADFNRYDEYQERKLAKRPCCSDCGTHIQQEDAVCLDGDWFCDECLKANRRNTEI